jgi:uncharacterized protein YeaO (DUF488 family)
MRQQSASRNAHTVIGIKRVYEVPSRDDGTRVLVDRLWPRGVSRVRAALDEWLPDVAPSPGLRQWFSHDPRHFAEFRRRYRAELRANPQVVAQLRKLADGRRLTLLYAARDPHCNHALVLAEFLGSGRPRGTAGSGTVRHDPRPS